MLVFKLLSPTESNGLRPQVADMVQAALDTHDLDRLYATVERDITLG